MSLYETQVQKEQKNDRLFAVQFDEESSVFVSIFTSDKRVYCLLKVKPDVFSRCRTMIGCHSPPPSATMTTARVL